MGNGELSRHKGGSRPVHLPCCIDIPSTFNAGLPEGSAFVRLGSERPLLGVIFPHSRSSSVTETASKRTQIIEKHRDREFCESLSGDLHKAVATLTDLVRLMRLNPTRVLG